ncbi:MAG: type III polyketide synthase, partial [Polyangiales bacterium]
MTTSTSTVMAAVCAPPAHCYPQEALLEALRPLWSLSEPGWRRARQFFAAAGVKQRHLAMPSDRYPALRDFSARNEAWIAAAYPLAQAATGRALVASGWRPEDIDVLCFVSVTGLAV